MGIEYSQKTAEIWDYFFEAEETTHDVGLYTKLLAKNPESVGSTLDIGCGTGRFSIPLAKQGYKVLGIDTCEHMLEVCKGKMSGAHSSMTVEHVGFEDFTHSGTFDGIVAFYVLQFILERKAVVDFFKKAHALLNQNGLFLISVYNSLGIWNPAGWSAAYTREFPEGFARSEYTFTPINCIKGIAKAADYRVLCKNDSYFIDYYTKNIRFYTLTEYKLMLKQAGFGDIVVYVDHQQEPMTDQTGKGLKLYISSRKQ